MDKKIVIIDGSSLFYRAFYALPLLSHNGIYTNAVYGFLRMLAGLYRNLDPEYIAVAFDKDRYTFRNEIYKDYKATRKSAPAELVPQFKLIKDLLRVMGVAVYEMAGYEGDDILGTLAFKYKDELPVLIVTGDRDSLQLSSEKVTVFLTQKGISNMAEMTPSAVVQKYGIKPSQIIDMKALMGDTSDNIPGVKGIGEKTAVKLLQKYENLENIYKNIEEIKGAQKTKLLSGKEDAYLSRNLAKIRIDIPINATLEEMKQPIHYDEMKELFDKLGLHSIAEELSGLPRFKMLAEAKKKEMEEMKPLLNWEKNISFEDEIISFVPEIQGKTPFFKINEVIAGTKSGNYKVERKDFSEFKKQLLKAKAIIAENSKEIFESDFPYENLKFYDVTLIAYLLDPTHVTYNRSYVGELFKVPSIYIDENASFEQNGNMIADFLLALYTSSYELLVKNDIEKLFKEVEQPLIEVLAEMEKNGISIDEENWKKVRKSMKEKEEKLLLEIYREAGEEFNVNSPKQLSHILFDKMGMPTGKKTKTGYSTAADVLESLAIDYPFVKNILEYRTLAKLISTYLDAIPLLVRKETKRVHTSFNQMVTATGRLSSSDPNLQNIPVRTEEGKVIRSLFVPGEGYDFFISSDYSQVELRVLAHMSGDEGLIRAFENKEDIHRRTASEVFGVPFEEVTSEQRSHAKAVNFGIIYGISDFGLSKQLGISRKKADEYIKTYLKRYPGIHEFMKKMTEEARKTGKVKTLFGRYRDLPDINSKNFQRRSFAERTAMNTPIQGSAADIMKIAMIQVYGKMKKGKYKSRILLQVHDELVVEAVKEEVEEISKLLKETMESVVSLKVKLVADVHVGKNWAETK